MGFLLKNGLILAILVFPLMFGFVRNGKIGSGPLHKKEEDTIAFAPFHFLPTRILYSVRFCTGFYICLEEPLHLYALLHELAGTCNIIYGTGFCHP
jgi:hypothetical protein